MTGSTPLGVNSNKPDDYVPNGTRFTEADVRPGRSWRHYRGGSYVTIGISRWSTNGADEGRAVVEYMNAEGKKCSRFADEFLDGRFKPVDEGGQLARFKLYWQLLVA